MINNSPTVLLLTAILFLSSSQLQQFHPIIVVVDAMKLTSLGSSIYDSSSSKHYTNHDQGEVKTEHGSDRADEAEMTTCSTSTPSSYGVDRSFPIHHPTLLEDEGVGQGEAVEWLPNKQQFYKEYMDGCRQAYHPEGYRCDTSEEERIDMNLHQPASMFVSCVSLYRTKIEIFMWITDAHSINNPQIIP